MNLHVQFVACSQHQGFGLWARDRFLQQTFNQGPSVSPAPLCGMQRQVPSSLPKSLPLDQKLITQRQRWVQKAQKIGPSKTEASPLKPF